MSRNHGYIIVKSSHITFELVKKRPEQGFLTTLIFFVKLESLHVRVSTDRNISEPNKCNLKGTIILLKKKTIFVQKVNLYSIMQKSTKKRHGIIKNTFKIPQGNK